MKFRTLLGSKNLEFSVYCLQSLLNNSFHEIQLEIFEDGTLTNDQIKYLEISIKNCAIIQKKDRENLVINKLKDYPECLKFRNSIVMATKLFDTILYNDDDFFYIDTDILFLRKFRLPDLFDNPIFMLDIYNAYSFSPIKYLKIKDCVLKYFNAGFIYYPAKYFDLPFVEKLLSQNIIDISHSWGEQTTWSFLSAKMHKASYFDETQIVMASNRLKITNDTIAVHLTKPFRYHYEELREISSRETDKEYYVIRLKTISKKLTKIDYTGEWLKRKVSSVVKRIKFL